MKRILIADDHAIVRKGLKETLEEEISELIFGEASNGQEVLQQIWNNDWDLVLLDIGMEGRDGLEILGEIRKSRPRLPVVMITMYPEAEFGARALKQGAAGYLNKQSAPEELVNAVTKVLSGGRYITPALAEALAAHLQGESKRALHESLSNRELQVMKLIAAGKSLKDIAEELSISVKTVATYHTRLLTKMNMKNDVELARYALLNKLFE